MRNFKNLFVLASVLLLSFPSEAKRNVEEEFVLEESGLNVTKITNENMNSVLGATSGFFSRGIAKLAMGGSKKSGLQWHIHRTLAISPDGSEIAYMTRKNKSNNIMVRRSSGSGASTQRTFRDVYDFCWGPDGNLYFSDIIDSDHNKIVSIDAHKGSTMRQLTSNNIDFNPATFDGNRHKPYFRCIC